MNRPAPRPAPPTREELVAGFDAFYRDARDRLLLQTFALTGDLNASRSAVRDAFVSAWHHWRSLSRTEAPEAQVRPQAWRTATRRSTATPWRRTKNVSAEVRATLDALGTLNGDQRAALLLTQLAGLGMPEMAREIGITLEAAQRELTAGAARFATERGIDTADIHATLTALATVTAAVPWPRVTIIRRAGAARRRSHTVIGVVAALVAVVGAGAVVSDPTGARPTLAREEVAPTQTPQLPPAQVSLPDTALLSVSDVNGALAGRWQEGRTTDNSTGNGLVHPCQAQRYADPRGVAAWVRSFRMEGADQRRVVQSAEASSRPRAAQRSYERARDWFAGCLPPESGAAADRPHTQLISTAEAAGIGDESAVFVLQDFAPDATHVVGLARTGSFVTVVSLNTDVGPERADRAGMASLLAAGVDRLCGLPDGGTCATDDALEDVAPYPVADNGAMLAEIDLPPVGLERGSLVPTPIRRVTGDRGDVGAVGCNAVRLLREYGGQRIRTNLFRTFVFVDSDLPATTGLTEVIGSLPEGRARSFVDRLRSQIAACPDGDAGAGTEVAQLASRDQGGSAISAWRLETALPGDRSIEYDVAVVRQGTALAQLVYVGAEGARMTDAQFVALAERAQQRLGEMPPHRR